MLLKKFSDFASITKRFDGEKIKLDSIINKEIIVRDFKIESSKLKKDSDYLTLQIESEGEIFIFFTGSVVLKDQIKLYQSEIPFITTIKKIHRYYTFT